MDEALRPILQNELVTIDIRVIIISILVTQSEHIGQWATPHHLSDVRRGAPSDISEARSPIRRNWPSSSDCL